MDFRIRSGRRFALLLVLGLMLVSIAFYGCSGDEYDDVKAQKASAPVMVATAQVNGWATGGYAGDEFGYTKLVILDVDSASGYSAGHVAGSYLLDTAADLSATRNNGVADIVSQVATKGQMDDLIQRTGIDGDTVVLITGSNMMTMGRAYFNFRYWGFPKARLKVMNGTKTTYTADGYTLSTTVTLPAARSTYSVCSLEQDTSVRVSLQEMIKVAEDVDPTTVILDVRTAGQYAGTSPQTVAGTVNYVTFEGHVKGSINQPFTDLLVGGSATGSLLPMNTLTQLMAANSVTSATVSYSYCFTSWRAAVTFLALDAALGWNTRIYDGAWVEWGQMSATKGGSLDANSPWLTDTTARSAAITYNQDSALTVEVLTGVDSFSLYADEINHTDANICSGGGGGDTGGAQTGGY